MGKAETERISEDLIKAFIQFKRLRMQDEHTKLPECKAADELKHSEILLLYVLHNAESENPNGISVSDISNILHVKPPSITPVLTRLEQMDMIKRSMDANDRRIVRIELKDEGRQVIDQTKRRMISSARGLVEHLGKEKSDTLTKLINESVQYISSQSQNRK